MDFEKYKNKLTYPTRLTMPKEPRLKDFKTSTEWGKAHDKWKLYKTEWKSEDDYTYALGVYKEEDAKLLDLFWGDLDEELGLNKYPLGVISRVHSRAWEDGHTEGLTNVFAHAQNIMEFVSDIFREGTFQGRQEAPL